MTTEAADPKIADALKQARAQLESITEMVDALSRADNDPDASEFARDEARTTIHEDALEVLVRSDWHPTNGEGDSREAEYLILLCTGGPAVRIVGTLSEYTEPETARLECQDWGTPWTRMWVTAEEEQALLTYASCFYFGE